MEYNFYIKTQPFLAKAGLRIPRMIYAQYENISESMILMFEFVDAEFYRVEEGGIDQLTLTPGFGKFQRDTPPPCSEFKFSAGFARGQLVAKTIAKWHSVYWGDQGLAHPSISHIPLFHESKFAKIIQFLIKKHSNLKSMLAHGIAPQHFIDHYNRLGIEAVMCDFLQNMKAVVLHIGTSRWSALVHNDFRIDNVRSYVLRSILNLRKQYLYLSIYIYLVYALASFFSTKGTGKERLESSISRCSPKEVAYLTSAKG
jgi:hypothetical protein